MLSIILLTQALSTQSPAAILIPLTDRPVVLTSAGDGVAFDWYGTGVPKATCWTRRDDQVAFLALDANDDGQIDAPGEFVSRHTVERATSGFGALARVAPHDGDGRLSSSDAAWSKLWLWVDSNHNGIVEPIETMPIGDRLSALALGYMVVEADDVPISRVDAHGNIFLFRAAAWLRDGRQTASYEVSFVCR